MAREVVIVDAIRTAVGKKNGTLSGTHPVDLLSPVLTKLIENTGIKPEWVEDVVTGCVSEIGEQGGNIGRMAVLAAGFPVDVPAVTLNRMCGSSQQALHFAAQEILAGDMDIAIACGVENMSRVPMGSDMGRLSSALTKRFNIIPQGLSAELIAKKWEIPRQELDEFSLLSHQKAAAAADAGAFNREILPLTVQAGEETIVFQHDEGVRKDTTIEKIAGLKPAFQLDGVVTAGNSSQISDGAAGLLLMSREKADELGIKPRARVVDRVVVGTDPIMMLTGVIPATRKVLQKAGLTIDQIDFFEVNEAFASVVLAWQRELGADLRKVNVRGGAIALGHPLGASGAKLTTTLLHTLEDEGARYGLQVMCIGFGMATATIIERL